MSEDFKTLKFELRKLSAMLEGVRSDSDFARIAKLADDLRFAVNYLDISELRENYRHGADRLTSRSILKKGDFDRIVSSAEAAGPEFVELFKLYEDMIIQAANERDKPELEFALERYSLSWAELEHRLSRKH
jgi:hypothetical protein